MTIPAREGDHQSSIIDDHVKAENSKFLKRLDMVQGNMDLLMNVMRKEVTEHEKKMSKLLRLKADQGKAEVKKKLIIENDEEVSILQELKLGKRKKGVETKFKPSEKKQEVISVKEAKSFLASSQINLTFRDENEEKLLQPRKSARGISQGPQKRLTKLQEQMSSRQDSLTKQDLPLSNPPEPTMTGRKNVQSFSQRKLLSPNPYEQANLERLKLKRNNYDYNTNLCDRNLSVPSRCFPGFIPNSSNSGHFQQFNQRQFGYFHPQDPEDFSYLQDSNNYGWGYSQEASNLLHSLLYDRDAIQRGVWQDSQFGRGPQGPGYSYRHIHSKPEFHILPTAYDHPSFPRSHNPWQEHRTPNSSRLLLKREQEGFVCTPNSSTTAPVLQRHQDSSRQYQQLQAASSKEQNSRKKKCHPSVTHRIVTKPALRKPPLSSNSISQFGKIDRHVKPESQNLRISHSKFHQNQDTGSGRQIPREFRNKSSPRAVVSKKTLKGLKLGPHDPKIAVDREMTKMTKKNKKKLRRRKRRL